MVSLRLFVRSQFCLLIAPLLVPFSLHSDVPNTSSKQAGFVFDRSELVYKLPLPPNPPLPALLDGRVQPKFVNQLVNVLDEEWIWKPDCKTHSGSDFYKIKRVPFVADLGIFDSLNQPLFTYMFGYASKNQKPTYPGRTFIVKSHHLVHVFWENKLLHPNTGLPLPEPRYVPVDETIHIANLTHPTYPQSGIPTVVHLHGGCTTAPSDGYPEAWSTPHFAQKGPFFMKRVFDYDNEQEAMMLWYHDHALGFTRLNNYAGLIGAYIIRGAPEEQLIKGNKLPSGKYEVPLLITDKMFTSRGHLFFPYFDPANNPNEPQPSIIPEFFGDFILVNGKAWPYMQVEPRPYRFRLLNGCDSRFLQLHVVRPTDLSEGLSLYQIGTDQGLLNKPESISKLLLAPAQRADVVIDFSQYKHQTLIITNTANAPFPGGEPPDPHSSGLVMAFKVTKRLDTDHPCSKLSKKLRGHSIHRLTPTASARQVLLFEGKDAFQRILPLLGTPQQGALHWNAPVTENPILGSTEIWEIYNTTEDSHPIHLHSGNFQIVDRQYFSGTLNPETGVLTHIALLGEPILPTAAERGLFDTVIVPPKEGGPVEAIGQRTRIIMKFTLPGNYVWHCHILSHEDHDMMRPLFVRKK